MPMCRKETTDSVLTLRLFLIVSFSIRLLLMSKNICFRVFGHFSEPFCSRVSCICWKRAWQPCRDAGVMLSLGWSMCLVAASSIQSMISHQHFLLVAFWRNCGVQTVPQTRYFKTLVNQQLVVWKPMKCKNLSFFFWPCSLTHLKSLCYCDSEKTSHPPYTVYSRDLRIVFSFESNRPSDSFSNRIFESNRPHTTQAVTQPNGLQAYRTACYRSIICWGLA